MQKFVVLFTVAFALVESIPIGLEQPQQIVPIVKQFSEVNYDGSFKNNYETGNGIVVDENGFIKNAGSEQIQVIQGSNAYTAPDGQYIQLTYTADENGYQPIGNHLPTPPTPHPIILKSLEFLASLPSTEEPQYAKVQG